MTEVEPGWVSVPDALAEPRPPEQIGEILALQALVDEIDIYKRQAQLSIRPEVKAKVIEMARNRLQVIRGIMSLNSYIKVDNVDLLDRQLSDIEAKCAPSIAARIGGRP